MTRYVVDSWAWIEYFEGSARGQTVKKILDGAENEILAHWITVAEVSSIAKRKDMDYANILSVLFSIARIHAGDEKFAAAVGEKHAELKAKIRDFGLAAACVVALAEKMNAKILTGDPHFKGIKNVIIL